MCTRSILEVSVVIAVVCEAGIVVVPENTDFVRGTIESHVHIETTIRTHCIPSHNLIAPTSGHANSNCYGCTSIILLPNSNSLLEPIITHPSRLLDAYFSNAIALTIPPLSPSDCHACFMTKQKTYC